LIGMGELAGLTTSEVLDRVLPDGTALGEVRTAMDDAHTAAWAATHPRLLELCRVRAAQLLGCPAEIAARTEAAAAAGLDDETIGAAAAWPTSPLFDDRDRAVMAFTEEYLIDVASLSSATAAAVREHLGDEGVVNFVNALLVVEQRIRLRLAWDALLSRPDDERPDPPHTGA
jgi:AhpD family alkylhydroperoxidase